jgi:hypothetical protein
MDDNIKGALFIGDFGVFKVYCDFVVICIKDVNRLTKGQVVTVTDVKTNKSGSIIYEIGGELYFHFYFVLYLKSPFQFKSKKN